MTKLKPVMKRSPQSHSRIGSTLARVALVFGVLFLALLIGAFVAGAAAVRSLQLTSPMSGLRGELLTCLEGSHLSSVEVTIPSWMAALGRVSASLADIDPQIKAALQAMGGGQVGVYLLAKCPAHGERLAMLDLADRKLAPEGWTRMVTVLEKQQLVAVYGTDFDPGRDKKIELFLIVMDQRELVIVSAKGFTEPLIGLASSALGEVGGVELALNARQMR